MWTGRLPRAPAPFLVSLGQVYPEKIAIDATLDAEKQSELLLIMNPITCPD
jgi:hypothetical protein